jgi:uncharacterized membrane protein
VFVIVLAAVFLKEQLAVSTVIGGALIVTGALVLAFGA